MFITTMECSIPVTLEKFAVIQKMKVVIFVGELSP